MPRRRASRRVTGSASEPTTSSPGRTRRRASASDPPMSPRPMIPTRTVPAASLRRSHHRQQDPRRPGRVVQHGLAGDLDPGSLSDRLPGAEVAVPAREAGRGDLEPDPVTSPEQVAGRPEVDLTLPGGPRLLAHPQD